MTQTTPKTPATGQQGFTLIEIIAVLVILGILAAVATPKFLDLQEEAKRKSLDSVVAAAQSRLSMKYAGEILSTGSESQAWTNIQTYCANDGGDIENDISYDGFGDTNPTIKCNWDNNSTTIEVEDTDGLSSNGTFTRP
jgi:MSHA pilin protein MshA